MDFSRLPCTPFLQILAYLPFNECVRSGRVNRSFRYISQLAIADTKSLDLTEHQYRKLCLHGLEDLLNLCSQNLEKITFPKKSLYATAFSTFQCPRLTELYLLSCPAGNDILERVVRNNPNLQVLAWSVCSTRRHYEYLDDRLDDDDPIRFPDIVNENLEKLIVNKCNDDNRRFVPDQWVKCNDDTLRSLTGRCPNLKSLEIFTEDITADVFDQFFASIPQLHKIKLTLENNLVVLEDFEHFWRLPLTSLSIEFWAEHECQTNDNILYKISSSLPHLKELSVPMGEVSSDGIASLANLHDLEFLELDLRGYDEVNKGIHELARCGKLRRLSVATASVHIDTLIDLIRFCPNLNYVLIENIADVYCESQAANILEKFFGLGKREVTIGIYGIYENEDKKIWDSEEAKGAISKLKENDGMVVKIVWPGFILSSFKWPRYLWPRFTWPGLDQ